MSSLRSVRSGAAPSIPIRPRRSDTDDGDGGHVVDLDAELRRERVAQERDGAAGERAEQVGRRARGEVLAAEDRRQVGVPVERTGREPGPAVRERRGHGRGGAGLRRVLAERRLGIDRGHRHRTASFVVRPGFGRIADRSGGAERRRNRAAPNRAPRRRSAMAADTQPTRSRGQRSAEVPRDGGGPSRGPADPELHVDVREVPLDRPRAERQRRGDLLVRAALGAELEDLALAGRERVERQLAARPSGGARARGTPRPRRRTSPRPARRRGGCGSGCRARRAASARDPRRDLDGVVERRRPVAGGLEDQRRRGDPRDARRRCRPAGGRSGSRPRSPARSTSAGGRRTSASAPRSRRG